MASDSGWIDNPAPIYNDAGNQYLLIVSQPEGSDYFKHLVLVDATTNEVRRLTQGKRVVTRLLGWDLSTNNMYGIFFFFE